MEKKLIKLMSDLAAFNQLTNRIVTLIGKNFNIDAHELCKQNGIIYIIK